MQTWVAAWARIRTLCVCLIMALSLSLAPSIESFKHGPGAMVAEAEHRSLHAEHGHGHEMPSGHHDVTDHDHVGAALLGPQTMFVHPALHRALRSETSTVDGTTRDGPRRPPRLTMI
jgi:hypothetical protein